MRSDWDDQSGFASGGAAGAGGGRPGGVGGGVTAVAANTAGASSIAAVTGFRIETHDGDRVVVPDPNAPPLWARFYDLKTGRPLFTGRDGIPRENLADIELERRTGYAWYGSWGDTVAREFEAWSRRHP